MTAVILGLELFGLASGPYLLLSCTIAYLLSGHRSAIPTQLLQFTKAPSLQAPLNQEIGGLEIIEKNGGTDENNKEGAN
jgi:H+/Cl- antiporter ClcA